MPSINKEIMKKGKIITSDNYHYMSHTNDAINEFIADKNITDIQFQATSRQHATVYAVMIVYEE